jgi:hypothetical protein
VKKTLADFRFDGGKALEYVLASSPYGGLDQAVASLALFSNPQTVAQSAGQALFRIVRGSILRRGEITRHPDGREVLLDDNTGPTDAFLWANRLKRGSYTDVQFCHVWQASEDPASYTNLANLCLLPAFLAKLSDTHPRIVLMLRWRAEQLYGWRPAGEKAMSPDPGYAELVWAEPFPATADLAGVLRAEMSTKAKSRTTISARTIGWVFSDWQPDGSLPVNSRADR